MLVPAPGSSERSLWVQFVPADPELATRQERLEFRQFLQVGGGGPEAGHEVATMALATAYLEGRLGLAPDRQKAIEWLERSAERGSDAARDRLARLAAEQE